MKKWVEKLIEQFDFEWNEHHPGSGPRPTLCDDRATLLFLIDTFNKHLIEVDGHPVRKVRETLDEFARELVQPKDGDLERILFRFRQFFAAYRIDECAYFQKTFEDFRTIIWDFVDQLSEDLGQEKAEDSEIRHNLDNLKEAVESNSIPQLKDQSRKFIDVYMEKQFKKEKRRASRMKTIRKNLTKVKKQLDHANDGLRTDHLTGAFNRKSFDEYCAQYHKLAQGEGQLISLLMLDIDHFKKINDSHGHPVGDFVLKELVKALKTVFTRDVDMIARIGGEEFAVLLPDHQIQHAIIKAEEVLQRVRQEAFIHQNVKISFTVSIGVAQLGEGETISEWLKRADTALYDSKNSGRNKLTVARPPGLKAA